MTCVGKDVGCDGDSSEVAGVAFTKNENEQIEHIKTLRAIIMAVRWMLGCWQGFEPGILIWRMLFRRIDKSGG
jgi:hypothetical protein